MSILHQESKNFKYPYKTQITKILAIIVWIGIITLKIELLIIKETSFDAIAVMTNGNVNAEKLG